MAKFTTKLNGMDMTIAELRRMGAATEGRTVRAMLVAGAEKAEEIWRSTAEKRGHRDNGNMIEAIGHTKPHSRGQTWRIDVYPLGDDGSRTNAEKAFVLHYGSKKLTGDHWVEEANERCAQECPGVMEAVFRELTKGK